MNFFKTAGLVAAFSFAVSAVANAAVIYDNGGVMNPNGNEMSRWLQAEDFSLEENSLITGGGFYFGSDYDFDTVWDGTLEYFIFADNSGNPGSILASGAGQNMVVTDTGIPDVISGNILLMDFDFASDFEAVGGTQYWLGLHLGSDYSSTQHFYWVSTWNNGTETGRHSDRGTMENWGDSAREHAFYLRGAPAAQVPEPGVLGLMGVGLVALALLRRRHMA